MSYTHTVLHLVYKLASTTFTIWHFGVTINRTITQQFSAFAKKSAWQPKRNLTEGRLIPVRVKMGQRLGVKWSELFREEQQVTLKMSGKLF